MLLQTRDFGEQSYSENEIITFPTGLFAFEQQKKYILIKPMPEETSPIWLQSLEDSSLCFILFCPTAIFDDYHPTLEDDDRTELEISSEQDILILSMAIIPEDYKQTTINLKSPLIINIAKHIGKQVILNEDYPLRTPVFPGKVGD